MLIVCPYTSEPHPDTISGLATWRGDLELVDVSATPYEYARLLRDLWAAGRDFLVVEHDVVPTRASLTEMAMCPNPYCAAPYPWSTTLGPALGHTRFRSLLLRTYPDAAEIASRLPSAYGRPGHWRQLDVRLMQSVLAELYGLQPCVHAPVEHRNPAKQLQPGAVYATGVKTPSPDLPVAAVRRVAAQVAAERAANLTA